MFLHWLMHVRNYWYSPSWQDHQTNKIYYSWQPESHLRPGVRSPIVYFADPRSHIWLFVLIAGPGLLIITPPLLSTEFNWIVKMYSSLLGVPVHWLYGKHLPLWALGVRLSDCQDIFYVLDYWVLSKSKQNIGKILSRQNIWIIFTAEKPFCYNLFVSRGR